MKKLSIGDKATVKYGPFKDKEFIVLDVKNYYTKSDLEHTGYPYRCLSSGNRYEIRFDDGKITKILDVELEEI